MSTNVENGTQIPELTGCGVDINSLPKEIFSIVLSYLPYNDIKACRCVSKKWYSLSFTPKILEKETLIYDSDEGHNIQELILTMQNRIYPYNWHLYNTILDTELNELLSHNGCVIRTLFLNNCSISEIFFRKFLECCCRVNTLVITTSTLQLPVDIQFTEQLETLRSLTISATLLISDCTFNNFVNRFPNMEYFSLSQCNQLCSNEPVIRTFYRDFYNRENIYNSESIFSIYSLFKFLSSNIASNIKQLDLTDLNIEDNHLITIVENQNLKLEKLIIFNCPLITDRGMTTLVRTQRKIQYLDASFCRRLTNSILNHLQHLNNLNTLLLVSCIQIKSMDFIKFIKKSLSLSTVSCEIPGNPLYPEESDNYINDQSVNNNLVSLNLSGRNYDFQSMKWILKSFPKLKSLDLSDSTATVTDQVFQYISQSLVFLESLNLSRCSMLTPAAFGITDVDGVIKSSFKDNFKCLKKINLTQISSLSDCSIQHYLMSDSLEILNLDFNHQLSCNAFPAIAHNLPNLHALSLASTKIKIETILMLARELKKLERLYLFLLNEPIPEPDEHVIVQCIADTGNKNIRKVQIEGHCYFRNYYTGQFVKMKSGTEQDSDLFLR